MRKKLKTGRLAAVFLCVIPSSISVDFRKQLEEDGDHLRNKKETLDVCWAKFVECEDDAKYKDLMEFANGSAHTSRSARFVHEMH